MFFVLPKSFSLDDLLYRTLMLWQRDFLKCKYRSQLLMAFLQSEHDDIVMDRRILDSLVYIPSGM